jgi:hypothetical protein
MNIEKNVKAVLRSLRGAVAEDAVEHARRMDLRPPRPRTAKTRLSWDEAEGLLRRPIGGAR